MFLLFRCHYLLLFVMLSLVVYISYAIRVNMFNADLHICRVVLFYVLLLLFDQC